MKLLVDVGNSRIKWATLSEFGLGPMSAEAYGDDALPDELLQAWQTVRPQTAWFSCVGGAVVRERLAHWCAEQGVAASFVEPAAGLGGLRSDYTAPEKLGVDRSLAMLGAWSEAREALCVVDCGTAVTIDLVAAEGRHLGGLILPGLKLMEQSLLGGATGIREGYEAPQQVAAGLGLDTASGVRRGALAAVCGAVEHVLAENGGYSCVVSGGDGEAVVDGLSCEARYEPDLVLRGLRVLGEEIGR